MSDVYLSSGLRTPFVKAGGSFAKYTALDLSRPVAAAMAAKARPDFLIWGQVIPDPTISNIARELVFEAGLDAEIPAFSTVMACSTSFGAAIQASGMVGRGGTHLALVGGVETMSHVPLALKSSVADTIFAQFPKDPEAALKTLSSASASRARSRTGSPSGAISVRSPARMRGSSPISYCLSAMSIATPSRVATPVPNASPP